ncbi:MAG: response regulator [Anaerolineaceae bacterium]|nr:response regulator [Anaerolineaceae bacterium]
MKVLIADDNSNSRQLLKDIIESVGHETVTAVDGPSAVETAQQHMPDLMILDVNMPGKNGFEVCALLKGDAATAQIPILMLTALGDIENRVTGLGAGADDYLTKPFSPRELVARVNARLRAKAESDGLRETKEMLRQTFERFVAPSVVERLLQDPNQVKLGGQFQDITVLFADLQGFTPMSEYAPPETLLGVLNAYHALIVKYIQENKGTVDKFIGDGVMALYNTPVLQANHPLLAVRTAIGIRNALSSFHEQFEPTYRLNINFGIHSGMAVVGNVGTQEIMDFTAVGDTVNLASRLQQLSTNGQILISSALYDRIRDHIRVTAIGSQKIRGRQEQVMVYEVLE